MGSPGRWKARQAAGKTAAVLYVAAILAFIIAPTIIVVFVSFHKGQYFSFPPKAYSLHWYAVALGEPEWRGAFLLSLELAVISAVASTAMGTLAGLSLHRSHFRGNALVRAIFLAPVALPGLLTGMALLFFFTRIGLGGSFAGLVVSHTVVTMPFVLQVVLAGLPGVSRSVEEAALVLGADELTTLRRVTLPLLRPAIASGALFAFILSFDNVMVSIFLTSARLMTLPVKVLETVMWSADPTIAAVSTIFVVISIIIMLVLNKFVGLQFAPVTRAAVGRG